ncbi:MAG: sucrose synthase [Spirochaetes bacterium]|nr:sucrose synthase [Spirochaetota bacterium]
MKKILSGIINLKELNEFKEFMFVLSNDHREFLLRNDIILIFNKYCEENNKSQNFMESSSVYFFIKKIQEAFIRDDCLVIMHRYSIARYKFYLLRIDCEYMEELKVKEYLEYKEFHVLKKAKDENSLTIDFLPFYDFSPSIKDPKTIGNGIRFLNRYLSSNIFSKPDEWNAKLFEFIKLHKYNEQQLLANGDLLQDFSSFFEEILKTVEWLKSQKPDTPFSAIQNKLKKTGFEPGWGNTAGRILETMQILIDLINEPTDTLLADFISRVPMPLISKIAIISPHGWFGQQNVLGKPDTGGQVIYILDQVRALEKQLEKDIKLAGLDVIPSIVVITRFIPEAGDTTSNIRKEKIHQTDNCWIIRVPFKDSNDSIINHWISRFHIWPYLEKFAHDARLQLLSEFRGRPDLIIGNYSDGNLVASLISDKLDVIQCTIAHALEKTKYLFSDIYWQNFEDNYKFSMQFTADILAMNKSDFIIASTHQEITGTEDSMGQYESYQFFTMPGLYQILNGVNLFAPKFNVIPPGVDENIYFPYYNDEKRVKAKTLQWDEHIFLNKSRDIYGELAEPGKIPIFTMARLDKIKNITGLIEAFGISHKLQYRCNLIIAAGTIHFEDSKDAEEQDEIKRTYALIEQYKLFDKIRWLPSIGKIETGEVYRVMADRRGIFVQPAHFEAFGLTILEAMITGLPTFGPKFGGPVEIIEHGKSGFLINTSKPELISSELEYYMEEYLNGNSGWETISENGIKRVKEHFNWKLHSERLINLSKLYGFWRYSVSNTGEKKMNLYSDLLYYFLFKERVKDSN